MRSCCLYLQVVAGYSNLYQKRIPLLYFPYYARKVVVHQNHSLFQGILPYNVQWQPHYYFPQHQFPKHCHFNLGEGVSKTHVIRNEGCYNVSIPNAPSHDEPDDQNPVHQKLTSGPAGNSIPVAGDNVIYRLASWMDI